MAEIAAHDAQGNAVINAVVLAPLTRDQIESVNGYQVSGIHFPLYCGADLRHFPLVAETAGLYCLDCEYTQVWVDRRITDWSWLRIEAR